MTQVANAYTSVATSPGYGDNTVKGAWDLAFYTALNLIPQSRQFVDVRPKQPTNRGNSITLQIDQFFSSTDISNAKSPLVEESDLSATKMPATKTVTLTPQEYGFVVTRTRKLKNRTMVPVDPRIAINVADHAAKTIDSLIQDKLETGASAGNTLFANGATALNTIDTTKTMTADDVRNAVYNLRVKMSVPWDGGFYTGLVHPSQVFALRTQGTGVGIWRTPHEYGTDQSAIWKGETGEFEGVRFVENPLAKVGTDGATSAKVCRNFFFGREALAEAVVEDLQIEIGGMGQFDSLNRFHTIGWYADIDWSVFRQESLVLLYGGSTKL